MPISTKPSNQLSILSVGQLTRNIKRVLENGFYKLSVEGEISNFTKAGSGHWYFTIKDREAQLPCVLFRGSANRVKFLPKEGMAVILTGRINVYEPRGAYQFIADGMKQTGSGELKAEYEKLKAKLEKEGLFDADVKRPLPLLPKRIALVTSREGAALKDMIRVIQRRNSRISMVVVPSLVQGDRAAKDLVNALLSAASLKDVEVVIIGRGGGSMEDLWAFNDEHLARAIRSCPVPVISAVGHETDFTIADYAADIRASTPSVAGELVSLPLADILETMNSRKSRIYRSIIHNITANRLKLEKAGQRLKSPDRLLADKRLRLDSKNNRLLNLTRDRLKLDRNRLDILSQKLQRLHPEKQLSEYGHEFSKLEQRLKQAVNLSLKQNLEILDRKSIRLNAMSPLSVLNRGYSITTNTQGHIIKNSNEVLAGDIIKCSLANGSIEAQVTEPKSG